MPLMLRELNKVRELARALSLSLSLSLSPLPDPGRNHTSILCFASCRQKRVVCAVGVHVSPRVHAHTHLLAHLLIGPRVISVFILLIQRSVEWYTRPLALAGTCRFQTGSPVHRRGISGAGNRQLVRPQPTACFPLRTMQTSRRMTQGVWCVWWPRGPEGPPAVDSR